MHAAPTPFSLCTVVAMPRVKPSAAAPIKSIRDLPPDERTLTRAGLDRDEPVGKAVFEFIANAGTEQSRLRYAKDVAHLSSWLRAKDIPLGKTKAKDLKAYLDGELSKFAASSQRRMLSVSRALYRALAEKKLLTTDPNAITGLAREAKKKSKGATAPAPSAPEGFSEAQTHQLLAAIEIMAESEDIEQRMLASRDLALVALAVRSGLRASEIVALRREQIITHDNGDGTVSYTVAAPGRNGQIVEIPLSEENMRLIERYIDAMETLGVTIKPSDPLWIRIGRHAQPQGAFQMTTRNLGKLVVKRARLAGIGGPSLAVQQLRRTTATTAAEAGASVEEVATTLRADVRTAKLRYLRPAASPAAAPASPPATTKP